MSKGQVTGPARYGIKILPVGFRMGISAVVGLQAVPPRRHSASAPGTAPATLESPSHNVSRRLCRIDRVLSFPSTYT